MVTLAQTYTAIAPATTASFQAYGGTGPYTYGLVAGGAGGSINATSGIYVSPAKVSYDPRLLYDVVQCSDSLGQTAVARILVGTPIVLVCDILQQSLGLASGRIYLWDQKLFQPTDSGMYVIVSNPICRPFGNTNRFNGVEDSSRQMAVMWAMLDIDVISRSTEARDRKEEVVMAFLSEYSQGQQYANHFHLGRLPLTRQFINLSDPDGAAIPYRYKISVAMQYAACIETPTTYFDNFVSFTSFLAMSHTCMQYGITMLTPTSSGGIIPNG